MKKLLSAFAMCTALTACGASTSAATETTPAAPPTAIERGEAAFHTACAGCHHPAGAPRVAGLHWDAAHMTRQIREGHDHMPAITTDKLSDEALPDVMAYLVSIEAVSQ